MTRFAVEHESESTKLFSPSSSAQVDPNSVTDQIFESRPSGIGLLFGAIASAKIEILTALVAKTLAIVGAKKSCGKGHYKLILDRLANVDLTFGSDQILVVIVLCFKRSGNGAGKCSLNHL